jgi:hypothetical protein
MDGRGHEELDIHEMAVPTVKRYVHHGLLAPVPFYGTANRYPRDHLVRLWALRYWRTDNTTLAELRRRLDSVTFAAMEECLSRVHLKVTQP